MKSYEIANLESEDWDIFPWMTISMLHRYIYTILDPHVNRHGVVGMILAQMGLRQIIRDSATSITAGSSSSPHS